MGSQSSSQTFAPAEDFGNELQDYLLDAPVLQVPSLRLSLHPVTGFTRVFTGTAAVFTRDTISEADALLKAVVGLHVQSPVFPIDIVFQQKPKTSQFEFVWIMKEGVQPQIIEWYFQHVCVIKPKPEIIQYTPTEPIEDHPLFSSSVVKLSRDKKARIVSYRARSLRTVNPLLSAALSHIRLKHEFIRSTVDMGVMGKDNGDFEMYIGVEEIDDNLAQEMERRKTTGTRFSENEFLYTLGQIASGLDYLQDSSVNFHLTTETVLMTADGKFTLDIGVPWPLTAKQDPSFQTMTEFGQLALQIATLEQYLESDYEKIASSVSYAAEIGQLLLGILHLQVGFKDVLRATSNLTMGRYLSEYETQIARYVNVDILRTRAAQGPYQYHPPSSINVQFRPPCKRKHGLYFGEWNSSNQWHGRGVLAIRNRGLYEGCWDRNRMKGQCRYIFAPNSLYEGEYPDINTRVCAKFVRPDRVTVGECFMSRSRLLVDGVAVMTLENRQYHGTWVDGRPDGWGTAIVNGVSYEGIWKRAYFESKVS